MDVRGTERLTGLEPANLYLGKVALYQLSYNRMSIIFALVTFPGESRYHNSPVERTTGIEPANPQLGKLMRYQLRHVRVRTVLAQLNTPAIAVSCGSQLSS